MGGSRLGRRRAGRPAGAGGRSVCPFSPQRGRQCGAGGGKGAVGDLLCHIGYCWAKVRPRRRARMASPCSAGSIAR